MRYTLSTENVDKVLDARLHKRENYQALQSYFSKDKISTRCYQIIFLKQV